MLRRKLLPVILAVGLVSSILAGCSGASDETNASAQRESTQSLENEAPDASAMERKLENVGNQNNNQSVEISSTKEASSAGSGTAADTLEGVSFVMIYDPLVYDELNDIRIEGSTLNTGDLSSQILTGMNRAGGLEDVAETPVLMSQAQINQGVSLDMGQRNGARAGGLHPVYQKGDVHAFYSSAGDLSMQERTYEDFECVFSGESCYIWSFNNAISEEDAEILGDEFDSVIFPRDVEAFGEPRFTDNGGKVSILMYPMTEGLGGYFSLLDIFAGTEVPETDRSTYGLNTDHAIIHINSDLVDTDLPFLKSTLAHELQHQICASDCFYYEATPFMRTWLNEAMSAYAEELVYPGIKEEGAYNVLMYLSDSYRKGQSLYNFDTDSDEYIGAYGTVYLFSRYLVEHAGEDVFHKIHTYWRESYDASITEASAIIHSVPQEFFDEIDAGIHYPSEISALFTDKDEEWMSKLALDFFRETLSMELADMEGYENEVRSYMLYTELDPQLVQGGGRMVVAMEGDDFIIPEDADHGMVYIGLDSDFQVLPDKIVATE